MALNPNVVVVAPGELITSAHLNNIRSNLDRLDTTRVPTTGGPVTGAINVGGGTAPSPTVGGVSVRPDGLIYTTVTTGGVASLPNLVCQRTGTPGPQDVGGMFVRFDRSNAANAIGSITIATGGAAVLYNTTSDGRLKDDLGPVDDPLGVINRLRPRRLAWKDTGVEFDGFIAQEVADVVPGAVTGDPDGDVVTAPMQLDVSRLVPYLVAAVQRLAGRVQALEAELDTTS